MIYDPVTNSNVSLNTTYNPNCLYFLQVTGEGAPAKAKEHGLVNLVSEMLQAPCLGSIRESIRVKSYIIFVVCLKVYELSTKAEQERMISLFTRCHSETIDKGIFLITQSELDSFHLTPYPLPESDSDSEEEEEEKEEERHVKKRKIAEVDDPFETVNRDLLEIEKTLEIKKEEKVREKDEGEGVTCLRSLIYPSKLYPNPHPVE